MASIILPQRWAQQPTSPIGVDWSHPLTLGLVSGWHHGLPVPTDIWGRIPTASATATNAYTYLANERLTNRSGLNAAYSVSNLPSSTGKSITIATRFIIRKVGNFTATFAVTTSQKNYGIVDDTTQVVGSLYDSGGTFRNIGSYAGSIGEVVTAVFVHDASANTQVLYINGKQAGSAGAFSANSISSTIFNENAGGRTDHNTAFSYLWQRALSKAEVEQISANPYQIWTPKPKRIWISAAGGPQSYSYTAAGGLTFAGAAATVRTQTRLVSGGIALSGTSAQTRGRTVTPSGGLTFGGTAAMFRSVVRSITGGLLFSGTAPVSFQSFIQSLTVTPVGGLVLSGSAAVVRTCTRLVSGGIQLSGVAAVEFGNAFASASNWIINALRRGRR